MNDISSDDPKKFIDAFEIELEKMTKTQQIKLLHPHRIPEEEKEKKNEVADLIKEGRLGDA